MFRVVEERLLIEEPAVPHMREPFPELQIRERLALPEQARMHPLELCSVREIGL